MIPNGVDLSKEKLKVQRKSTSSNWCCYGTLQNEMLSKSILITADSNYYRAMLAQIACRLSVRPSVRL